MDRKSDHCCISICGPGLERLLELGPGVASPELTKCSGRREQAESDSFTVGTPSFLAADHGSWNVRFVNKRCGLIICAFSVLIRSNFFIVAVFIFLGRPQVAVHDETGALVSAVVLLAIAAAKRIIRSMLQKQYLHLWWNTSILMKRRGRSVAKLGVQSAVGKSSTWVLYVSKCARTTQSGSLPLSSLALPLPLPVPLPAPHLPFQDMKLSRC